jgi:hypothetical protein
LHAEVLLIPILFLPTVTPDIPVIDVLEELSISLTCEETKPLQCGKLGGSPDKVLGFGD